MGKDELTWARDGVAAAALPAHSHLGRHQRPVYPGGLQLVHEVQHHRQQDPPAPCLVRLGAPLVRLKQPAIAYRHRTTASPQVLFHGDVFQQR
eukprot:scaffold64029_cov22-Prasinocladus_malaysianus.AAC.1